MSSNQSIFKLDEIDRELLFATLFDQDTAPNEALVTAVERYNQLSKRP
ncbi:MAG: hypothetical protein RLZZ242_1430 [Bacteroidota bacterium]|jgi:uncharacterized protein (DUF1778 family)